MTNGGIKDASAQSVTLPVAERNELLDIRGAAVDLVDVLPGPRLHLLA